MKKPVNHLASDDGNWKNSYCGKKVGNGVIPLSTKSFEQSINLPPYKNYVVICSKCFSHFLKTRKSNRSNEGVVLTLKMIHHKISAPLSYFVWLFRRQ